MLWHFQLYNARNGQQNSSKLSRSPCTAPRVMRVLIAHLLAQASALLFKPHRTLRTHLRSDPRDEAIEVEAYVEDLIDEVVKDVKKAKEEEINQQSVDAMKSAASSVEAHLLMNISIPSLSTPEATFLPTPRFWERFFFIARLMFLELFPRLLFPTEVDDFERDRRL